MKDKIEIKVWKTDYTVFIPIKMVEDINSKYPNYDVSVNFATEINLDTLKENESVCYGDGKSFMFVLTKKQ